MYLKCPRVSEIGEKLKIVIVQCPSYWIIIDAWRSEAGVQILVSIDFVVLQSLWFEYLASKCRFLSPEFALLRTVDPWTFSFIFETYKKALLRNRHVELSALKYGSRFFAIDLGDDNDTRSNKGKERKWRKGKEREGRYISHKRRCFMFSLTIPLKIFSAISHGECTRDVIFCSIFGTDKCRDYSFEFFLLSF